MPGTIKRTAGPLALTSTLTTNVYNNSSALIYDVIRHLHVANKTASAHNFTLYIGGSGGTGAGNEWFFQQNVNADSVFDWYGTLKLLSTDFIVGGADANTALTLILEGEQYVV